MDRGNPMMGLPQTGKPKKKPPAQLTDFGRAVKIMFFFNVIFLFTGMMILGVGIWIAVDRNFMAHITGTVLFSASLFILISAGCLIIILSFLGCCGAVTENRTMLGAFLVALAVIFAILLTAGIIAFVFRGQLGNRMKAYMSTTLETQYGVRQEDGWNRAITWSWDQTQSRLSCCAVDDRGWSLYRLSAWYRETPGEPGRGKAFVPPSCCVTNPDGSYYNREFCQTNDLGPPGENNGPNSALFFRGCYGAGVDWLYYNSRYILIFGFTALGCLVFGIIASGYLLSFIKD